MTTSGESAGFFTHGKERIRVERFEPATTGPHAAVLLLHGRDGLNGSGALRYRLFAEQLAAHRFATLLVHYFGSTLPRNEATDPAQFLGWVERIGAALTYAETQPGIDGKRLGLLGLSLGGYLALTAAARDRRVRAVVECAGGLPPPIEAEVPHLPPVLILHGTADAVVPVSEAQRLERLLREQRRSYEMRLYPGEGHVLGPASSLDAVMRTVAFLQRHLAPGAVGEN